MPVISLQSGIFAVATSLSLAMLAPAGAQEGKLWVEHAEIVLAPPPVDIMAGYLVVSNQSQRDVLLTGVESNAFGSVTMHRTEITEGTAGMRPVERGLAIPRDAELVMRRGGIHLMLEESAGEIEAGDKIPLTLSFEDGRTLSASAVVRPLGSRTTDHHHGKQHEVGDN